MHSNKHIAFYEVYYAWSCFQGKSAGRYDQQPREPEGTRRRMRPPEVQDQDTVSSISNGNGNGSGYMSESEK